jgi:deoxyribodipyrimidine photo-lyase
MGAKTRKKQPDAIIVWFRRDLRLSDNPALSDAVSNQATVIPVFVWTPDETDPWKPGAASKWWLHQSLDRLRRALRAKGSRLILRCGSVLEELDKLLAETGAQAVYWNRRYEPRIRELDHQVESALAEKQIEVRTFNGALLAEPWEVSTKAGKPFRVFTPFWRACLDKGDPLEPVPEVDKLPRPRRWPDSLPLEALELEPKVDWAAGIRAAWKPGEDGAQMRLESLWKDSLDGYEHDRDRPDVDGTSMLSPHLHFGEISPRQVLHAVQNTAFAQGKRAAAKGAQAFIRQLYWREFAYHLLYHEPQTINEPLRPEFTNFPWAQDPDGLRAWQKGRTGYPYIDAGMRQLWQTGWMHNRLRMAVASFLVKDLLIPWQEGAKWFWDTLVDADLANNTLGWQWVAGCGADAAPYFRIFNPVMQGERFDPQGDYIRRWVPELAKLPNKLIHRPWEAPKQVLQNAQIALSVTYPRPVVDHADARDRALQAFSLIRGK